MLPTATKLRRRHIATLGVFDSNVMSSHFTSHHVMSRHVTSQHRNNVATFWVRMKNVAMLGTNVVTLGANVATLLEIYEQCHDVGHERHNVAGFSSDRNYSLPSWSFFILTILYDLMTIYIKNNTRSKPFHTKNIIFETFENMVTKNRKLSTINRF